MARPTIKSWVAGLLAALLCAAHGRAQQSQPQAPAPQDPTVRMSPVDVTATKETQLNSIDRKIYNVGKDLQASTGSAADILQNIPSVEVDLDGNISLRGDSSVQILVDGKSSALLSSSSRADVLTQMPADSIERIEVITNPSARYKPDGSAGIINIVLKRNRTPGYSGSVKATAGSQRRYGLGGGVSMNPGRISLSGNYSLRQDDRPRSSTDQRNYTNPTTGLPASTRSRVVEESRPFFQIGKVGAELKAGRSDTLSEVLDFSYRTFDRHSLERDTISNNLGAVTTDYERYRYDPENEGDVQSTTSYSHAFGGEDRMLTADLQFEHHAETERNHYTNTYVAPASSPTTEFIRVGANEPSSELSVNYVDKSRSKSRLELGFDGTDDKSTQDHLDLVEDPATGAMVSNPQVTNRFYMDQAVGALYATYRRAWGHLGVQVGGRFEAVRLKTDQITSGIAAEQRYNTLYPSLHLAYDLSDTGQLQLNYSKRTRRPEGDDLNPYPRYQDPYNLSAGNPYLRPEETDSFETGYQYKNGDTTYLGTLFYRESRDSFTWVSQYVSSTTLLSTQENLGRSGSGGLELAASASPVEKLTVNASGDIYYNEIDASNLGYSQRQSTIAWSAKVSADYALSKQSLFQLNTNYTAKRLTPQGYREPTFVANFGFKHTFRDKKLAVVVTVSDLFNSLKNERKLDVPGLHDDYVWRRSSRIVYVGLVYRFGASKGASKEEQLPYDNQL